MQIVSGRPADVSEIPERIRSVRRRVQEVAQRCGRDPASITLIAVCKTVGAERIRSALEQRIVDLAENRIQEAELKIRELGSEPVWHFVGHLQSNKASRAAQLFDWIHSVDSVSLGERLDRAAQKSDGRLQILMQVNLSGESNKSGVSEEEASRVAVELAQLRTVRLRGLMIIPALTGDPEGARRSFVRLRELRDMINRSAGLDPPLEALSMGMTNDFEVAIEEGATHIRLGRALFGERPTLPPSQREPG
ncbi:MAG: YggS family pyridoxal phosphate-dependent enzyme [Acidobacteria bacterium]|nr:YggS family pyridoxal phosphate-dependent enzyme [Acidobacteriota bacterium]